MAMHLNRWICYCYLPAYALVMGCNFVSLVPILAGSIMPLLPVFHELSSVSVIVDLFILLQIVDFIIVESVFLVISVFQCALLSSSVSIHPGKLPLEISSTNDIACWQVPVF